MTAGGAGGSKFAAHMSGKLAESGRCLAGMGLSFRDPKVPYNVTFAKGISFSCPGRRRWHLENSSERRRRQHRPCREHLQGQVLQLSLVEITLTEKWQKYTIPFSAMTQPKNPTRGEPRPPFSNRSFQGLRDRVEDLGQGERSSTCGSTTSSSSAIDEPYPTSFTAGSRMRRSRENPRRQGRLRPAGQLRAEVEIPQVHGGVSP